MVTLCTAVALASALRAFVLSLLFRDPPCTIVELPQRRISGPCCYAEREVRFADCETGATSGCHPGQPEDRAQRPTRYRLGRERGGVAVLRREIFLNP